KIAAVALVALGLALPYPIYRDATEKIRGIANEPAYSTRAYIAMRETQARGAAQAFGSAPVRAMFEGGMCMFAYYSRLPYLAEMSGLTQYSLAPEPRGSRAALRWPLSLHGRRAGPARHGGVEAGGDGADLPPRHDRGNAGPPEEDLEPGSGQFP